MRRFSTIIEVCYCFFASPREIPKFVIKQEDIQFIVRELEFAKDVAELLLRKHKGNLESALSAYVRNL